MRPAAWVELLFGWLELPQLLGPGVYLFWVLVAGIWLAAALVAYRRWGKRPWLWIVVLAPLFPVFLSAASLAFILWLCTHGNCFSAGL